jgi:hypothetical protein
MMNGSWLVAGDFRYAPARTLLIAKVGGAPPDILNQLRRYVILQVGKVAQLDPGMLTHRLKCACDGTGSDFHL